MLKRICKIVFLFCVLLSLSGCVTFGTQVSDGGVLRSADHGSSWEPRNYVGSSKKGDITIAGVSVLTLEFDPKDPAILYLGTADNGAFKTTNHAEKWERMGPSTGPVQNIAINSQNTDEIYLTQKNVIYRSQDQGHVWNIIDSEPRGLTINDFVVDSYLPDRLYRGLANGELQKSMNQGISWSLVHDFGSSIKKVLVDPRDTRRIFVFTATKGVFRSTNLGLDWVSLADNLVGKNTKKKKEILSFKDAVFDFSKPSSLLYASQYGLYRTDDNGETWKKYQLLASADELNILAVGINHEAPQGLFYTSGSKLFKSDDDGQSWIVVDLPSSKNAQVLLVHPGDSRIIYIGMKIPPKEKKGIFF